ncbi:MAG: molybdopterin molybdotransferase MoeA [Spirulina sp. SIO3F2]|nr:molybdopterin molybdotransferase MoeA [Spirulina sp. SIO3F2]
MIPVPEAETQLLNLTQPLTETELLPFDQAHNRILAKSVISTAPFPYWDNSAMDGYAVRAADVQTAPVTLEVIEEIPAGIPPQKTVQTGQAARIFTGAMLPTGADTIVMQEDTQREGDRVTIQTVPQPQAFVRHQGSFVQPGDIVLRPGCKLGPAELAILATVQCTTVEVYRRPRVAIFSTGDELITPAGELAPGKIVDSNQYALAAFLQQQGATVVPLGIVPDDPKSLREAIATATQQSDLVLSTGGVSVGDYDYIDQLLAELGGEIKIQSVAIKPGKPLTVATFPNCLYLGIPGNPVSALVCCWRFVRLVLQKMSGQAAPWILPWQMVRSRDRLTAGGRRETYLWGQLQGEEFVLSGGSHSSGNLMNLAQTNALAVLPVGITEIEAGAMVRILRV